MAMKKKTEDGGGTLDYEIAFQQYVMQADEDEREQLARSLARSEAALDVARKLIAANAYIASVEVACDEYRAIAKQATALLERGDEMRTTLLAIDRATQQLKAAHARKEQARKAINARHDQPRGYRQKRQAALDRYAKSRDMSKARFAEEEASRSGVSIHTVRKWLENVPKPESGKAQVK